MPWLAPFEDAPDTHRMWVDAGSTMEAAMRASGWTFVVSAPGSVLTSEQDDEQDATAQEPVVEQRVKLTPDTHVMSRAAARRAARQEPDAAVDRKP